MENEVAIHYTNHRGETRIRIICPMKIWHGVSPYHEGAQWFLDAFDIDNQVVRSFAMRDIHAWDCPPVAVTPP